MTRHRVFGALWAGMLAVAGSAWAADAPASAPHGVSIAANAGSRTYSVRIDGALFTEFHAEPDASKPYLWPLLSEDDVAVTRAYPMEKGGPSTDHPHHRSCWTGHGDVNGVDFWLEGRRKGRQVVQSVTTTSDEDSGTIQAAIQWQDRKGRPVLDEVRSYRFYATPADRRYFDVVLVLTAAHGAVRFGDTKEGGLMAVRMRPELEANRGGHIVNAAGQVGEANCWGRPSAWCDYTGTIDGVGERGITIFDAPTNLRHPTPWHVRAYGLLAANCFALGAYTDGKEDGAYTLPAGESITFRYRVLVHAGPVDAAELDALYQDFAAKDSTERVSSASP